MIGQSFEKRLHLSAADHRQFVKRMISSMANSSNNPLKSAGSLVDEKEFASKAKVQAKRSSGGEGANAERVKLVAAMICLLAAGALIAWQLEVFSGGRGTGAVPPQQSSAMSSGQGVQQKPSQSTLPPTAPESIVPKSGTKLVAPDGTRHEYVKPPPALSEPVKN